MTLLPNLESPGRLIIGVFSLTAAQPGTTLLTITLKLIDPSDQGAALTYSGEWNGTTIPQTPITLGTVPVQNQPPSGAVTVGGTATQGQTLTAANTLADGNGIPTSGTGAIAYQWLADGTVISGATTSTLVLGQAQVGKAISVRASYTDNAGNAESVTSSATAAVANVNDSPTGAVTITGTAVKGQTLTASNTLADADGIPSSGAGAIAYQWLAGGTAITGATGSTYTLTQADVGKTISVRATYTDNGGAAESVTSTATAAVANVNISPTGAVTISGTATQGQTLTAANTLADADGIPSSGAGAISYQWLADGTAISGSTGSTLVLTQALVGKAISVRASYTDNSGIAESVTSSATTVANVNDPLTGGVTLSGTSTQGQTLTAANTLADIDGIPTSGAGAISYQWLADGSAISGATGSTFAPGQAQVGKAISVRASYTDNGGTVESATSAATAAVANVNDSPAGTLSVAGLARKGQTLTADNQLTDADGIPTSGAGAVAYQWLADGSPVSGATDATYVLTQADVGKAFSVKASYTDNFGAAESVTSAATGVVSAVNTPPAGAVSIAGSAKQGETLTASNTLADIDGIPGSGAGALAYQWLADGSAITGATGSTFVLPQSLVGKTISVKASYTDTAGTAESVTSAATAAVTNANDAPTGAVTVSGTAKQGETLAVSNTLADADGIPASGTGAISYQWLAGGAPIAGATGTSLVLTQSQVGKIISVKASYTDNFGTAESVTSAASAAVVNVNDAPSSTNNVPAQAFDAGQSFKLELPLGLFTDIDGDALTLTATKADGTALPSWLKFDAAKGVFNAAAGTAAGGQLPIKVTASDGSLSASATFNINVTQGLPPQALSGRVLDGYVAGASIFIDRNGDGIASADEDTGLRTDAQGNFNGTGFGQGAIIAVGGTNIDTGLRNTMTLTAPAGSTVISPVTTLVQSIVKTQGVSVEQAQTKVATAFGLPAVDLLTFDPLAAGSTAAGVSVQKVNAQVAMTATLAGDTTQVVNAIARTVNETVTAGTGRVDLGNTTTLQAVTAGLNVSEATQTAIAQGNTQVAAAESLQTIAQTQQTTVVAALPPATDWTAPSAVTFSPAVGATGVALTASPSITFSEAVQRGNGSIVLKNVGGSVLESFNVASSTRVTINGSTLTLDPTADLAFSTTYILELQPGSVQDAAGNAYAGSFTYQFRTADAPDVTPPKVQISSSAAAEGLVTGQTATIQFTLTESSTTFTSADVRVTGGTLSNFTGSGQFYSATFTPAANSTANGTVSVASGTFTDAAGNANDDGADADNLLTLSVNTTGPRDTTPPTVALTSSATAGLAAGRTATITFTLSEDSKDFTSQDVTVTGGTLSGFAGSGRVYTAVFTPAAGSTAEGTVRVASGTFSDKLGNLNTDGADADNQVTLAVDTVAPKVAISVDKTSLLAGQTAKVSFTLSEDATDFAASDVQVSGGSLSGFEGSGKSYSATFTPAANTTAQASISVASGAFTDAAGNTNADGAEADNAAGVAVRTTAPQLLKATPADGGKGVALGANLVFSFSEKLAAGKGAIVLKTAAGEAVETFNPRSGDGSVTIVDTAVLLNPKADLKPFTSYVLDFGSDSLQNALGNGVVLGQTYDFRTTAPDGLYQFFVVAFDAAPGATYMGDLAAALNSGMSLKNIVEVFTQKKQFTDVYATSLSNSDFATQLVNRVVEDSASAALKASAAKDITDALNAGWSRGETIFTVFGNLAAKPTTDADWGGTASLFRKEVAVARYVTEQMELASTDLAVLRGVIDAVTATSDVSTADKIVELIGTVPPGP
jgi:hypothetical protein